MTSGPTTLVIGGTGLVGEAVIEELTRRGLRVRAFARNPTALRARWQQLEVVAGAVEDSSALAEAIAGVQYVHVSLKGGPPPEAFDRVEHQGVARIASLAAQHGIAHLSYISGDLVTDDTPPALPSDRAKWAAEQTIRASGVPFTIFRPAYIMETLRRHAQGPVAAYFGRGSRPLHMVAAVDLARMVVLSRDRPQVAGKALAVHGPEAWSIRAAVKLYASSLTPRKRVIPLPMPLVRAVDRLVLGRRLAPVLDLMEILERDGERGDPTETNRLLFAPTTTLAAWCNAERGA